MPAIDKGITLTFAKKNFDVKDILKEKKANGIIITDYICNAIRFYEKNKDNVNSSIDINKIERMIEEKIEQALKDYKNIDKEAVITNEIKDEYLEDIDDINDDDLGDD